MRIARCLNIRPSIRALLHDVHHVIASVAKPNQASLLSLPLVPWRCWWKSTNQDGFHAHPVASWISLYENLAMIHQNRMWSPSTYVHIRHLVPTRNFVHVHLPQKIMILAGILAFQIPIISIWGAALKISLYKDPIEKTLRILSFHDTESLPEDTHMSSKLFLAAANRQPHLVQRSF